MPIVTLTTDFGHKDYSVSVIKGALMQQISDITIIDISHEISPYNPSETAYILKNAFRSGLHPLPHRTHNVLPLFLKAH